MRSEMYIEIRKYPKNQEYLQIENRKIYFKYLYDCTLNRTILTNPVNHSGEFEHSPDSDDMVASSVSEIE
jgi:hypothetical protein